MMRPILPPSPHARGQRPYVFAGEWHGDPVPGTKVTPGKLHAAMDAAWLFTGLPMVKSESWTPPQGDLIDLSDVLPRLYPFQRQGATWLYLRDYAILADEMGLGKSPQALTAAEMRLHQVRAASPTQPHVLILCPALAKRQWQRYVKQWTGWDAAILDGLKPGPLPQARYLIANYDILFGQRRRDSAGKLQAKVGLEGWAGPLAQQMPPLVILDEAHMLRGKESRRTQALKELCKYATVVWALTGTPMPNHVRDIWSLGDLVSGGLLGTFFQFAKAYCGAYQGQYGYNYDGSSRLDELGQRLSFWMLGRSKAVAGVQLPEKRREIVTVDVGEVKATVVQPTAPVPQRVRDQGKINAVALALRVTARAKRAAIIESAKEALDARQKVVVGVYLREQAEEIGKALAKDYKVYAVSGDVSVEGRDVAATAFRDGGPAAFVCTIDSMGVAVSLVGADLVIVGDLNWDPTKLLQFEGRAHRIGSTRGLIIRYLIAAGTIDEAVQEAVIEKLSTVEQAIGGTADGKELTVQLGRDMSTTEQIIDRLFAKLTGGA